MEEHSRFKVIAIEIAGFLQFLDREWTIFCFVPDLVADELKEI